MPLFAKSQPRSRPDSRTLTVESPFGPNREITFDDEETAYIQREWKSFASVLEGYVAPANLVDETEKDMVASYLLDVARARLERGEFETAATTCLKSVGVESSNPFAWLLLAEVFARYGDRSTAAKWLKKAKDAARSQSMPGPPWKECELRVKALL